MCSAGVIAGVLVFFLLVIIICAGVFVWIRYGSAKRNTYDYFFTFLNVKNGTETLIYIPLYYLYIIIIFF